MSTLSDDGPAMVSERKIWRKEKRREGEQRRKRERERRRKHIFAIEAIFLVLQTINDDIKNTFYSSKTWNCFTATSSYAITNKPRHKGIAINNPSHVKTILYCLSFQNSILQKPLKVKLQRNSRKDTSRKVTPVK